MTHKVFFGSPFNENFKWVRESVRNACEDLGLEFRAVDETSNPGEDISLNMFSEIETSSIAVMDVSEYNPNVMYELGILYSLSKPTVILAETASFKKLPFDIRSRMIIKYDKSSDSKTEDLEKVTKTALKRLVQLIDNPSERTRVLTSKIFSNSDLTKLHGTQLSIEDFKFDDIKERGARQLGLSNCKTIIVTEYNGTYKGWEVKAECYEGDMIVHVDINGDIRQARRK